MSDPKTTIRNLIAAADRRDLEGLRDLYAPWYHDHAMSGSRAGADRDATIEMFRAIAAAFPDTTHTIHALIAEDDLVVARVSACGTHTGTFRGLSPTYRRVEMTATAIYRITDGRITERWCDGSSSILAYLDADGSEGR